jgi:hypothetical protein
MTPRLDIGKVFARVFETYRAQAAVVIPAAFIVFLPVSLVSGLAYEGGSGLLTLLGFVAGVVGSLWLQGVVVGAVADIQDDHRDESVGSLFAMVGPVLGRLLLAGLLAAAGIGIGFLLLIVPGLVLLTLWSLVIPVIVLERSASPRRWSAASCARPWTTWRGPSRATRSATCWPTRSSARCRRSRSR